MAYEIQSHTDGWNVYADWVDSMRQTKVITKLEHDLNLEENYDTLYRKQPEKFIDRILESKCIVNGVGKIYEQYHDSVSKEQTYAKDASISKQLRAKGNDSFKEGNYVHALKFYSKSIQYAPYSDTKSSPPQATSNGQTEDSNLLPFALANRSAALWALGRFTYCLEDIELSIKYGYPKENLPKLWIRKIKCLHSLSVWANDSEQIKQDLKRIANDRNTPAALKAEIQHMFDFIEQTKPEEVEKDELETIDGGRTMNFSSVNKMLPQAADTVEMAYSPDVGRYMLATKQIFFGRPLIVESPYAFLLCYDLIEEYCYNCATRMYGRGIGCKNCTQVLFCSEECREDSHSTHSLECSRLLAMHESIGVAYLVMKILYATGFQKAVDMYRRNLDAFLTSDTCPKENDEGTCDPLSLWTEKVYDGKDYESVWSLMDHCCDFDYEEMFGFCITAIFFYHALEKSGVLPSIPPESKQNFQKDLNKVIVKHLLQLSTNVIAILDQNVSQTIIDGKFGASNVQENPIGIGLYPTVSLLNHSCKPNVISMFHDKKMVVRAAGTIKPGEEISYCYGPSIHSMSRKDRQARLKRQYYFDCKCEACVNNEEDERRAIKCTECQGPVIYNNDMTNACLQCYKSERDISEKLDLISSYKRRLDEAIELIDTEDYAGATKLLIECDNALEKLVNCKNPLVSRVKSELCRAHSGMCHHSEAIKYCLEDLALTQKVYGENSYEAIFLNLKLIGLKYNVLKSSETQALTPNIIEDLNNLVNETRQKLKEFISTSNVTRASVVFEEEMQYLRNKQSELNELASSVAPT